MYLGSLSYQALCYSSTPTVCLGIEKQMNTGSSLRPVPTITYIMKSLSVFPGDSYLHVTNTLTTVPVTCSVMNDSF